DILGSLRSFRPGFESRPGRYLFRVVWGASCWHLIERMNIFCVFSGEGYRVNRSKPGIAHPFYGFEDSQS
ncbi:MAG TPA: hypothetical protein PLY13_06110, partial [Methanoregulaceae archaeon]|nr:hypothetical protein [Methanoregulaceae archaeon]